MTFPSLPSACRCIPVLYPAVNSGYGSQPILQFKELAPDHVRYDAWKLMIQSGPPPRRPRRSLPTAANKPTVPSQR